MRFEGLYTIALTPFSEGGEIDEQSIGSLARFYRQQGVQGMTVLGIMGEVHKLSEGERLQVMHAYLASAQGMPVVVGCSAQGTEVSVSLAKAAELAGAAGIMVAPPTGVRNDELLFRHFSAVANAVHIPVVIQDEPVSTGVALSPSLMARLAKEVANVQYVKVEEPPTPSKVSRILAASEGRLAVFGGLGGMYFYEELLRGAAGVMTGFAYPEVLVKVYRLFRDGLQEEARKVFYHYLPLIRFEAQLGVGGVSIRKDTFKLRKLIRTSYVRSPVPETDPQTLNELVDLITYLGLTLGSGA